MPFAMWHGAVHAAPFGGALLMLGWLSLAVGGAAGLLAKRKPEHDPR